MKIYRPVSTNKRTQTFGESKACARVDVHKRLILPLIIRGKANNKCRIGYTSFYEKIGMKGHNGEDWATFRGENLYFNVDAVDKQGKQMEWWSRSEVDNSGGIGVDVFSSKRVYLNKIPKFAGQLAIREYNENRGWVYVKFRYWHLQAVLTADAKRRTPEEQRPFPNVELGQLIAKCDSTGASSGDHVHRSMKIVAENAMTLDSNNGFFGAVYSEDWYENTFIVNVLEDLQEQILTLKQKIDKFVIQIKILFDLI